MYKTHTEAARKEIITKEMESVAAKEYRTPEEIRELVAKGQAVICANRLHKCSILPFIRKASYQTQFVRGYVIKLFCFILSQNTLKHLLSLLPFQV